MTSEYLEFVEVKDTGKTKVWDVMSRSGGYRLAQIRWHGPWRQYTMRPELDTIWNVDCLADISGFIVEQMAARKAAKA
jgi:hypothetical protein